MYMYVRYGFSILNVVVLHKVPIRSTHVYTCDNQTECRIY